jgi:hypothetical protein
MHLLYRRPEVRTRGIADVVDLWWRTPTSPTLFFAGSVPHRCWRAMSWLVGKWRVHCCGVEQIIRPCRC